MVEKREDATKDKSQRTAEREEQRLRTDSRRTPYLKGKGSDEAQITRVEDATTNTTCHHFKSVSRNRRRKLLVHRQKP